MKARVKDIPVGTFTRYADFDDVHASYVGKEVSVKPTLSNNYFIMNTENGYITFHKDWLEFEEE